MKNNKLFQSKIVKNTQGSSRIKYNRAYLMSSKVAQEFNTYNYLLGIALGLVVSIILSLILYKHKKENIIYLLVCTILEVVTLYLVKDKLIVKTIANLVVIIIYHLLVNKKVEISL